MVAQETSPVIEQQLENLTDRNEGETEDDALLQQLHYLVKHPLNLNTAQYEDLQELKVLSDLQIHHLLLYRKMFGDFISVYELQAVPSWNIAVIKKILPFISVSVPVIIKNVLVERLHGGEQMLLARLSSVIEKAKGYGSTNGNHYLGNRLHYLMRYKHQYKNNLSWGITADKDPGETFFKSPQKTGFDFYSAHFFARDIGKLKAIAIGDYTVNLGQGLIQWQSLAFKKSADVLNIKRQSATIKPYSSAGEYFFNRGAAATVQTGNWEITAFGSFKKNSANFTVDAAGEKVVSSILTGGYHRTLNETAGRYQLQHINFGERVMYRNINWHLALNSVYHQFNYPLQKRDEPYNRYSIAGSNWNNYSIDYSYTRKNFHFFGEAAADKNFHKAYVNGLLVSVNSSVDLSFLYRNISKAYQAIDANAFTENNLPSNESGVYLGASIRPLQNIRLDVYADYFKFPWLKYLVDAPSKGKDFLLQVTYSPGQRTEMYSRFKSETKEGNLPDIQTPLNYLQITRKQNWRTQFQYQFTNSFLFRNRIDLVWYKTEAKDNEQGFLAFIDLIYNRPISRYGAGFRLAYFETDSYQSRLYAYENDVLYSYSIPLFAGKGFRYYFNSNYEIKSNFKIWLRWSQTIYRDQTSIGSGLDTIDGHKKSEAKVQLTWQF